MNEEKTVNFLNTPPCPFRKVHIGKVHCSISTDAQISEVDPLICQNCEVPEILSVPQCRYLSLGTEVKHFRGAGRVVPAMACRELNIKIYNIAKTCGVCDLYTEVDSLVDVIRFDKQNAEIQISISDEIVEQVARDLRIDYGSLEVESPPLKPVSCWRFAESRCRKSPIYTQGKVTVVLAGNEKNDDLYSQAIAPALRELNLQPYRIGEELLDIDAHCRVCENMQESDYFIARLDDWSAGLLFLLGFTQGAGRRAILLKDEAPLSIPVSDLLDSHILEYTSHSFAKQQLLDRLKPQVITGREDR